MSETSQELQGLLYDEDELDEFSDDVEQQRERSYERESTVVLPHRAMSARDRPNTSYAGIESSARGHSWRNLVLVLLSGMALILLARSFARGSVESSPETAQQQQDQRSQQQDQSGQSQQWSHPVVTTSDPYDTHEETPDDTSSVTGSGNVSSDNDDWQIEFAHIGYRRPITYELENIPAACGSLAVLNLGRRRVVCAGHGGVLGGAVAVFVVAQRNNRIDN
ncbi:MAG: hypothetical protein MHM6MM_001570 [Cercozoa sp. M6MM]